MTIKIKEKNKGKFTEAAERAGMSVQQYAKHVLNNPNATTLQKKRANFARNAASWKHQEGGTLVSRLQKGKPIESNKAIEAIKSISKGASDSYKDFSNSPLNLIYDLINSGLYIAAPFTGGATLIPAMAMSIAQGAAAANNAINDGIGTNNTIDMIGGLLAGPAKLMARPIMKTVGKSTKYVKNARLFKDIVDDPQMIGNLNLARTTSSLFNLARKDAKYVPYFIYSAAMPTVSNGQIVNDAIDIFSTQVAPQLDIAKQLGEEYNKRKVNVRLQ